MARASSTDYPIEQYVRDAKIDTLYEGTTAIQGQDLFFRKIVKDRGRALGDLSEQITGFVTSEAGNGQLKEERALLQRGLADVGGDRRASGELPSLRRPRHRGRSADLRRRAEHHPAADGHWAT